MKPEDCHEGQGVVYRPDYPGSTPEDGVVVRVGVTGLVFVRYGLSRVQATNAADLEPLAQRAAEIICTGCAHPFHGRYACRRNGDLCPCGGAA